MIYTLLYLSPFLKGNKNRNMLMYAIGSCAYVSIHCILFSTFGEKNKMIQKYRNLLYGVVACDLLYCKYKYDAELIPQPTFQKFNQGPIIEPVEEEQYQITQQQMHNNMQEHIPRNSQPETVVPENNIDESIKVYTPQRALITVKDDESISVYKSTQLPTVPDEAPVEEQPEPEKLLEPVLEEPVEEPSLPVESK